MPQALQREILNGLYRNNELVTPNKITIGGIGIDLSKIAIPTYFFSTKEDHIAPWDSTFIGLKHIEHAVFVLGGSGHVSGVMNSPNKPKYGYKTNEDNSLTSEQWEESATSHDGSWWTNWNTWVSSLAPKTIMAPSTVGSLQYPPLEEAPGRYVYKKCWEV